jgi:hypothetical protein
MDVLSRTKQAAGKANQRHSMTQNGRRAISFLLRLLPENRYRRLTKSGLKKMIGRVGKNHGLLLRLVTHC